MLGRGSQLPLELPRKSGPSSPRSSEPLIYAALEAALFHSPLSGKELHLRFVLLDLFGRSLPDDSASQPNLRDHCRAGHAFQHWLFLYLLVERYGISARAKGSGGRECPPYTTHFDS